MTEIQARLLPLSDLEEVGDERNLPQEPNIIPKSYTGMYSMHKYWAKKPYNVVRWYVRRYSKAGEIVLDPFCGYGITAIESLICGRRTIAVDLNPVAAFITRMSLIPLDLKRFSSEHTRIRDDVKSCIDDLYRTRCPKCKQDAITTHTIWRNGKRSIIWYRCDHCSTKKGIKEFTEDDSRFLAKVENETIRFWYPQDSLFENWRINVGKGQRVCDLFSKRNLYALAMLYDRISRINDSTIKDVFKFTFTASLSQASNMVFVIKNRGGMSTEPTSHREEVGSWVIGFWVPPEHFEINVWECFENRYRRTLRGKIQSNEVVGDYFREAQSYSDLVEGNTALVCTADAASLSMLPDDSVDYIFTDPPHGDRVPYFELSLLWSSWLGMKMDFENEIVVSNAPERQKTVDSYRVGLYRSFVEMSRVLKPGKYASIAFNNLDDATWLAFLDACFSAGFRIHSIFPLAYSANSVVQDSRQKGLKSDFVITCLNTREPFKPFTYNSWIEGKDSIRAVVLETGEKLHLRDDGATTTEILNVVVPQLLKENRVFKISDVIALIQENFVVRNLRWYERTTCTKGPE